MTDKKVCFITGAGRGMGVDIARAAMTAGDAVVATARNIDTISAALGQNDDLLAVKLDVTDPTDAEVSVRAAMDRFGRVDVLVNNAGNFYAGFFEEISPENFRAQIETTMFGPMNVTRAVLPIMRAQRAIQHPHDARRARLLPHRAPLAGVNETIAAWNAMNGKQGGDPVKLADALVQLGRQDEPPPLRGRGRRRGNGREEGQGPSVPGGRLPRAVERSRPGWPVGGKRSAAR